MKSSLSSSFRFCILLTLAAGLIAAVTTSSSCSPFTAGDDQPDAAGGSSGATDSGAADSPVVETSAGDAGPFALDTFAARTVSNGFGTAEIGGEWTTIGEKLGVQNGTANFFVDRPGHSQFAALDSLQARDLEMAATINTERIPVGGPLFVGLQVRGTPTTGKDSYVFTIIFREAGITSLTVAVHNAGNIVDTNLGGTPIKKGEPVRIKAQVLGVNPTTLRFKAWRLADPEPTIFPLGVEDNTPTLQQAGRVSIEVYLSKDVSADAGGFNMTLDDFVVERR